MRALFNIPARATPIAPPRDSPRSRLTTTCSRTGRCTRLRKISRIRSNSCVAWALKRSSIEAGSCTSASQRMACPARCAHSLSSATSAGSASTSRRSKISVFADEAGTPGCQWRRSSRVCICSDGPACSARQVSPFTLAHTRPLSSMSSMSTLRRCGAVLPGVSRTYANARTGLAPAISSSSSAKGTNVWAEPPPSPPASHNPIHAWKRAIDDARMQPIAARRIRHAVRALTTPPVRSARHPGCRSAAAAPSASPIRSRCPAPRTPRSELPHRPPVRSERRAPATRGTSTPPARDTIPRRARMSARLGRRVGGGGVDGRSMAPHPSRRGPRIESHPARRHGSD